MSEISSLAFDGLRVESWLGRTHSLFNVDIDDEMLKYIDLLEIPHGVSINMEYPLSNSEHSCRFYIIYTGKIVFAYWLKIIAIFASPALFMSLATSIMQWLVMLDDLLAL